MRLKKVTDKDFAKHFGRLDEKFFLRELGMVVGPRLPCQWVFPDWQLVLESVDCEQIGSLFAVVKTYGKLLKAFEELRPVLETLEVPAPVSLFLHGFDFTRPPVVAVRDPDRPAYGDGLLVVDRYVIPIRQWLIQGTEEEWRKALPVLRTVLQKVERLKNELFAKYIV